MLFAGRPADIIINPCHLYGGGMFPMYLTEIHILLLDTG
jgi:hypothetical protein